MINQRYRIIKLLGKGRSSVYLCEDTDLPGANIAIKILPAESDEDEKKLFFNEYFILNKINHPNIVKTFDSGVVVRAEDDDKDIKTGSCYFTLEYIEGKSLNDFEGIKDENILIEIIKQLSLVLYYLHLSNYIYYDLKPENVLVSIKEGRPELKLIDLGFAQCTIENKEGVIRGTAEYIAPEILKNEHHDYRVDFYSLGMLLYRLIYKKFPFNAKSEVDIYKAQIEQEFEFPGSPLPVSIINTVKKLLAKNPDERYSNGLQIINDLNIDLNGEYGKDFLPAKVFAGRKDSLTILRTYISDKESREVFTVRGSEGAGKTTLAYALYSSVNNAVLIESGSSSTGAAFFGIFIKKLVNNSFIFANLSSGLLEQIDNFISNPANDTAAVIKSIINSLASKNSFVLIIDSFNSFDEYSLEIFRNIIPILQANGIKVILTENSDRHNASDFIINLREINLTPFTEAQLDEYLDKSFAPYFPKVQLKQLIVSFADLLPGSLENFIRDLILLNVIKYSPAGIEIKTDESISDLLRSSHEDIYNFRLKNLTGIEKLIVQFLSSFEVIPGINILSRYLAIDENSTAAALKSISNKNIIHQPVTGAAPVFTSDSLKKYIYSKIENSKTYHESIAGFLTARFPEYNRGELARQFELAGSFEQSYKILSEELAEAGAISAYNLQRNILQRLLTFPLSRENSIKVNVEYCRALTNLNDYNAALEHIKAFFDNADDDGRVELSILKSKCLAGLGELDDAKDLLGELIKGVKNPIVRSQLMLDLANVNFNLNSYETTAEICNALIKKGNADYDTLGSAYQLLGLISIYKDDDLDTALEYFDKTNSAYQAGGLKLRQAGILMNIGNIYSMKGDDLLALENWNKSLNLNQSMGNIQQEARLLINFGIYYFNSRELENSTDNYSRAYAIFNSLGIKDGQGLVDTNLGEIFLLICEYQKAYDSLKESAEIFGRIQNMEEELQALFLLGKLYYTVGDTEKLYTLLEEFGEKLTEASNPTHKINYEYLKALYDLTAGYSDGILKRLVEIRSNLQIGERKYDYFHITTVIVETMMKLNILDEAAGELKSEGLLNLCSGNNLLEAERNYLLGILSELNPLLVENSPVDYFMNAYNLILDLHLTELTWKVLYALFKIFNVRGNLNKSREYGRYSLSLIKYIGDSIKDSRLRKLYFDCTERKAALNELNYFEEQF